jgi:hypothetical protein
MTPDTGKSYSGKSLWLKPWLVISSFTQITRTGTGIPVRDTLL